MLFKIITKEQFKKFIVILMESNEVIGPKQIGHNKEGKPLHLYLPVDRYDEIDWEYGTTQYSAKTYFLPFEEKLSSFSFSDQSWQQEIHYRIQPRAIVGLHACDIEALVKLDKVFARDFFPSPYYISRRKNTFIIGIDHEPLEDCFCKSLGADTVTHGFDLFLTDLGDRYFVSINSDRGYNALKAVKIRDINKSDTNAYLDVRKKITDSFQTTVDTHHLPNLLDIEFEADVWKKWGDRCFSCGSCAMVCPTCYCYGVNERVSMDHSKGTKLKKLYSCNIVDFATVAGGHNFRPDRETRLKYRYYHQHRGFVETYDEPKCVGCNRCGRVCLAGINPPEVIQDLQAEQQI